MQKRKIIQVLILTIITIVFFTFSNNAKDKPHYKYIGNKKCKMCHSKAKSGAQFKSWQKAKHSKAFEVLASPEAKKIAAKKGIADPQKDGKCLKCHVTAYGVDAKFLGKNYKMEDGVGCESCHGPGEKYWKKKTMTDITMGKVDASSVGLIEPNETVCKKCHNEESPTYKEFKFEKMFKKIAHPIPEDYKKKKGYK